jgi:tRNA splicing endonuclease
MEMLSNYLQQTSGIQDTGGLDALKQSLYSASYTHERLVQAVGMDHLVPLASVNQLMQYILRLQVGGHRPLKAEEKQALQDSAAQFQDIYAIYEDLMTSGGSIISSQNEKLRKKDEALSDMIHKKLLQ